MKLQNINIRNFKKTEAFELKDIRFKLEYLIYPLFLLPYLGTGIPAYIFALFYIFLNYDKLRFKWMDIVVLSALLIWFVLKLQQSQIQSTIILLRYYFGFYIFYLFFNTAKVDLNVEKLLLILCIAVIAEAVLINTVISPQVLPNYPNQDTLPSYETRVLGFYQRPYSFGNNASISSTLIVLLLFYLKAMNKKISAITRMLSTLAVILLASGEGYMLLLLYYIFLTEPFKNSLRLTISLTFILVLYILIFVVNIGAEQGLEKISSAYIQFLFAFKSAQVENVRYLLNHAQNGVLIGQKFKDPSELIIWSDFAWNDMYFCTGILGVGLLVFTLLIKISRYNAIPFFILIIGALHYGAIFSLPGQLFAGYLFSLKKNASGLTSAENLNFQLANIQG